MSSRSVDVLIIGGGLTGATLLLALQGLGFSTLLVETKPFSDKINPDFDARSLALSPASQRVLNTLELWPLLKNQATAIEMIHVSDQHRFGISRLQGDAHNPLGYVLEMQHINMALQQKIDPQQVLAPATLKALELEQGLATISTTDGELQVKAHLIVAADGTDSLIRQWCKQPVVVKHYEQQAIVANIGLSKPHEQRAYERFTAQGPLALLPMKEQRMSLVWALNPQEAERILRLEDAAFLKELQQAFGYRLGRFLKAGKRYSFPLKQVVMPEQVHWPVVFVGNSAHTLHPVAGQGFNLGLRDVATLAQCITSMGLSKDMLQHYLKLRHHDQQTITHLTDGLIRVFTSRLPGIAFARNLGLLAFDHLPILKNLLARYARGYGGVTPDLVCEIALSNRSLP
ncbi:MAG: 2-octaprenyl-6-methoxyphenyl hydroxylase [Legionella sp.]|nr:MAG: 2-octaprenyl-6-methoxyphenyl hydroxylase [Legionella sp.]